MEVLRTLEPRARIVGVLRSVSETQRHTHVFESLPRLQARIHLGSTCACGRVLLCVRPTGSFSIYRPKILVLPPNCAAWDCWRETRTSLAGTGL